MYAFLDDIYLLCQPDRVATLFGLLSERCRNPFAPRQDEIVEQTWCGARGWAHVGTTSQCWGPPSDLHTVCWSGSRHGSWKNDCCGMPSPSVPDLRCAWAVTGAKRQSQSEPHPPDLPPSLSHAYGEAHDAGIWNTVVAMMHGLLGFDVERDEAQRVATLPMRMGGLGLGCATRCAEAAF